MVLKVIAQEKRLYLDIDGTLFNSNLFGEGIKKRFTEVCKTTSGHLSEITSRYFRVLSSGTDFNPDDFLRYIAKVYGLPPSVLTEIFWDDTLLYKQSLYAETSEILLNLSKTNTLGIFSEGFPRFQKNKLVKSGIINFFDEKFIVIRRRKLTPESLRLIPGECPVVDDNLAVCETLLPDHRVIWLNRKTADKHAVIRTIQTLNELTGM